DWSEASASRTFPVSSPVPLPTRRDDPIPTQGPPPTWQQPHIYCEEQLGVCWSCYFVLTLTSCSRMRRRQKIARMAKPPRKNHIDDGSGTWGIEPDGVGDGPGVVGN